MKIAPLIIGSLASLPIVAADNDKATPNPAQNRPLDILPSQLVLLQDLNDPQEEQEPVHFFRFKREDDGRISIVAEPSTKKITDYLKEYEISDKEIKLIISNMKRLQEKFNETVFSKEQVEVGLSDIPKAKELPKDLKELKNEKVRNELEILYPSKRDYLYDVWNVLDLFANDGSIYPISVLVPNDIMTAHGYPLSLFVKDGMGFSKESLKERYYVDPHTGLIEKGVYLELLEKEGKLGPGGKNSVLIPVNNLPLVVVAEKEVFFIGLSGKERAIFIPNQRDPKQERLPFPKGPNAGLYNPTRLPLK